MLLLGGLWPCPKNNRTGIDRESFIRLTSGLRRDHRRRWHRRDVLFRFPCKHSTTQRQARHYQPTPKPIVRTWFRFFRISVVKKVCSEKLPGYSQHFFTFILRLSLRLSFRKPTENVTIFGVSIKIHEKRICYISLKNFISRLSPPFRIVITWTQTFNLPP